MRRRAALVAGVVLLVAGEVYAERLDGVAAIVDDDVILISDLERHVAPVLERMQKQRGPLPPEVAAQLRRQALQALIDEKLIEDLVERAEMHASDEEVDAAVEGIAKEEAITPEQVYAVAEQHGLDRKTYRETLGKQISQMRVVQQAVSSRVTVTDEEVRSLWEERYASAPPGMRVRGRHILIPWPEEGGEEAHHKAVELLGKIRERIIEQGSESFPEAARQFSAAASAAQGGLTVFREGEVAKEIAAQIFTLEPGAISPVIETEHGANLFQVLERYDPSQVQLEDVKERLHAELVERKTEPEYRRWMETLRKNRYIEIVPRELQ